MLQNVLNEKQSTMSGLRHHTNAILVATNVLRHEFILVLFMIIKVLNTPELCKTGEKKSCLKAFSLGTA